MTYTFEVTKDTILVDNERKLAIKWDIDSQTFLPGYAGTAEDRVVLTAFLDGIEVGEDEGFKRGFEKADKLDSQKYYYIHIMQIIANEGDLFNEDQAEDDRWAEAQNLYEEFCHSEYNTDDKSEYDCIQDFVDNYQKIEYQLWDKRTKFLAFKNVSLYNLVQMVLLSVRIETDILRELATVTYTNDDYEGLGNFFSNLGYDLIETK